LQGKSLRFPIISYYFHVLTSLWCLITLTSPRLPTPSALHLLH
jgi:hypothetical protein